MVDDRPRPGPGASPRGPALLPHERVARRICKLVGAKPLTREELQGALKEILLGATTRLHRETGMQYFKKGLELAFAEGWIREREGRLEVTEAGASIALRSRSASRRARSMDRLRF